MAPSSCKHAQDCVLGAQGSAYLPSACLASHGLQSMARSCTQPASLLAASRSFGGELGSSQPATHFLAFPKGCCSFPSAAAWSFGKQLWVRVRAGWLRDARGEALQGARSVY